MSASWSLMANALPCFVYHCQRHHLWILHQSDPFNYFGLNLASCLVLYHFDYFSVWETWNVGSHVDLCNTGTTFHVICCNHGLTPSPLLVQGTIIIYSTIHVSTFLLCMANSWPRRDWGWSEFQNATCHNITQFDVVCCWCHWEDNVIIQRGNTKEQNNVLFFIISFYWHTVPTCNLALQINIITQGLQNANV